MHTHTSTFRSRRARVSVALALALGLLSLVLTAQPSQAQDDDIAAITLLPGQSALRINEFMASNQTTLADPDEPDQFPDWVEIYNPTTQVVSLNGLALTDREIEPGRAPFVDGVTIQPNGYIVFYLDGDLDQGAEHLDLGLSADGEFLGLFEVATGTRIDGYTFGAQTPDVSEGRKPDGTGALQILNGATPGRSNQLNPPVIANLARSIAQPQAGDTVVVSADITDEGGTIVAASLIYTTPTTSPVTLPMTKSGNSYSATLPARPANTFVRYIVSAQDNDGNVVQSRWGGYVVGYVAPVIKINEFMAENFGFVEDRDDPDEFPDWMELYNPNDTAISLDGFYLTDNTREPDKFAIPNGFTIPARGVLLIYLDNDPEQGPAIHANFSLDKDGDFLGLYGARGTVAIDTVTFGQQFDNVARGRYPNGEGGFVELVCTTPGRGNILCDEKNWLPTIGGAGQ